MKSSQNFNRATGRMIFVIGLVSLLQYASAQTCSDNVPINTCIGTLNDGSGIGNYSNNLNCSWTISNPLESPMQLSFAELQTEDGLDQITIYDGPDDNATVLGSYSGSSIPEPIFSSSGVVHITFTSNNTNTGNGWQLNWNGTKVITACTGVLEDGSGPSTYDDNQYNAWKIAPSGASSVTLTFNSFHIESKFDYFYVYDGPDQLSPMVGAYSGNFIPEPITTGPQMLIVFMADGSGGGPGWEITYTSDIPAFTACEATFDQVEQGQNYAANTDCFWLIEPNEGDNILLSFTEFNLVENQDYLYVHDGPEFNAPLIAQLTGATLPSPIQSSGATLFVRFVSDESQESNGFAFEYECQTSSIFTVNSPAKIQLYPNPNEGDITLQTSLSGQMDLRICDIMGKTVFQSTRQIGESGLVELDVRSLAAGTYFLRLGNEKPVPFVKK
jgi:cubilin